MSLPYHRIIQLMLHRPCVVEESDPPVIVMMDEGPTPTVAELEAMRSAAEALDEIERNTPVVPEFITKYQLSQWLTEAQHGAITAGLSAMPNGTDEEKALKFKARMAWLNATNIRRDHPLIAVFAPMISLDTESEIDEAFIEISQII